MVTYSKENEKKKISITRKLRLGINTKENVIFNMMENFTQTKFR